MATVHRAKERGIAGFERIVALKRLLPHLAEDEMFVRSFVREAKLAALLSHANIVQLFELGRVGPQYFISMEYIKGRDIRKILRQARRVTGPPPIEVIVSLLFQTCDALDYAHTRQDEHGQPLELIHRDVSPSNLLITESGHVKVIDFGIAKARSQNLRTQTGRIKGKMAYMAPEAIKGLELDARSDLFAIGVLAHELLTARPLFASKNDYQTLQRVQNAELIPPSKHNADCPPELDEFVLKALSRDRDLRWQSAEEMRDALTEIKVCHKFNAKARTVSEWMDWAFALETPMGQGSRSYTLNTGSRSGDTINSRSHTGNTAPMSSTSGIGGVPNLEEDDEILEIAWEGRSQLGPVLLDDVPDVSDRAHAFVASSQTPSTSGPLSDGVVAAAAEASKSGSTLIAYVPPPPNKDNTPNDWANGTRPPTLGEAIPQPIQEPQRNSHGIAAASTELSGDRVTVDSQMHVAASARATTAAPVIHSAPTATTAPAASAPLARPNRRPTRTATFGASIIEQKKSPAKKIIAAVAIVMVVAGGGYLAMRGSGNSKAAASGTKAGKVNSTATGGGAQSNKANLRFVVEPKDATISIEGYGKRQGTNNKVRVKAGSYKVQVKRDGYKSWTATIDVEPRENQTVRVALAPEGSDEASEGTPTTDPSTHRATHTRRDKKRRRRNRTKITQGTDDDVDESPSENDDDGLSVAGDTAQPANLTPTITPTIPAKTAGPKKPTVQRPAIVPPHKVKKLSGSLPELRRLKGEALPSRLNAKLCINTKGRVTSVGLITAVPPRMKRTLVASLHGWRYRPYKSGDALRAACFVQSFKLR